MKRNATNLKKYKKVCKEIWESRGSRCEECGTQLGVYDMETGEMQPQYTNFHHINGRRTEELCLDKENIIILCDVHHSAKHGINLIK